MRNFPLIPSLLCIAWLAIDFVALDLAYSHRLPESPCLMVLGLALGQVGLMACYLVWGRGDIVLRLGGLIASVAVWSWMLATLQLDATGWMRHLMAHATLVTAVLATERSWRALRQNKHRDGRKVPQFSIWNIVQLTTCVAITLGMVRAISMQQWINAPLAAGQFCLVMSGVCVIGIRVLLKRKRQPFTWSVPILSAAAAGLALSLGNNWASFWDYAIVAWVTVAVIMISAAVLRVAEAPGMIPGHSKPVQSETLA